MMQAKHLPLLLLAFGLVVHQTEACPQDTPAPKASEDKSPSAPFIRLVEEGSVVHLQVAARSFQKHDKEGQPSGPRITLCAAMHVGESAFYSGMQKQLDACDVVLFEGVGGQPIALDAEGVNRSSEKAAIAVTRRRMRASAIAIARFHLRHHHYPADLDQLSRLLPSKGHGHPALIDFWGTGLIYQHHPAAEKGAKATFSLLSLGADKKTAGEGVARDLAFSDQPPIEIEEIQNRRGIQQDMAQALGLVFQLDAMSHLGSSWRNSDATAAELMGWLKGEAAEQSALLSALDGSSFVADIVGNMLRLFSLSRTAQSMLRLVTIEVLARAEQVLQSKAAGLGDLMEILLDQRNKIVLGDLEELLAQKEPPLRIGIVYGAAHQSEFQAALAAKGFLCTETIWRTAARVDLDDLGLPRAQVDWTRRALARSIDSMLK
jgi:hypothetical protein